MGYDARYARHVGRELTAHVFEWVFVNRTVIFAASGALISPSHRLTVTIISGAIYLIVNETRFPNRSSRLGLSLAQLLL